MKTATLVGEWWQAVGRFAAGDLELLHDAGLPRWVLLLNPLLIGAMPMRIHHRHWRPDEAGFRGFVTPVRGDGGNLPEISLDPGDIVRHGPLIDLVAWHPSSPGKWALRADAAEWLGAIAAPAPGSKAAVRVWRDPFGWLKHGAQGIVPLTPDPAVLFRVLAACPAILAENKAHADELQQALAHPTPLPQVYWPRPRADQPSPAAVAS